MTSWSALPFLLAGLLVATILAISIWLATPAQPSPEVREALEPDARMAVRLEPHIAFLPADARGTGLVLYPGARVNPRIYARVARAIADHGYLTLILPMPLNLALLAPGSATIARREHPQVERWVLAGHSLGGVAAAHYARGHPLRLAGLALWAAVPLWKDDLSAAKIPVPSIYASEDALISPKAVLRARRRLPPDTDLVEIVGENHAQFGRYLPQPGSRPAKLSPNEQQARVVRAMLTQLSRVEGLEG